MFDVVVPLYNKSDSIERCLKSILNQNFPANKIIIVNDGSTDDSASKLVRLANGASQELVIIEQDNKGVSAARNAGISFCESDYVCFLDADDEWTPDFLDKMRSLVRDYPSADLYCLAHSVFRNGKGFSPKHGYPPGFRGYLNDFFEASSKGSVANSSKVSVLRSALLSLGGFPEGVTVGEDLFVWIKLALNGRVACDATPAVIVHQEFDEHRESRASRVPYPIEYYSVRKEEIKGRPVLKRYLIRIGLFHVAGSKLERDWSGGFRRAFALYNLTKLYGFVGFVIMLIPRIFLLQIKGKKEKRPFNIM